MKQDGKFPTHSGGICMCKDKKLKIIEGMEKTHGKEQGNGNHDTRLCLIRVCLAGRVPGTSAGARE